MSYLPEVTTTEVGQILLQHYRLHVKRVIELESYYCRNLSVTAVPADKTDTNNVDGVREECDKRYVLKVFSAHLCHRQPTTLKQIKVSQFLLQRGFVCPDVIHTTQGALLAELGDGRLAELMTLLPGKQLEADKGVITATVLYELGVVLAVMHQTLQDCNGDDLDVDPNSPWTLENMHLLSGYLHCIQDGSMKERLYDIVSRFTEIKSGEDFRSVHKGVIHGDFHSLNIIVDWEDQKVEQSVSGMSTASWDMATLVPQHPQLPHSRCTHQQIIRKYGIIDFEETSFSYPVLELSRLMADMMIDCQLVDVMDIGGHVIAGYMSVNSFPVKQFHYLYETALTCLAQYIILGTHEHQVQEGANVYVMIGVAPSLQVLDKLKGVSSKRVYRAWAAVLCMKQ